MNDPDKRKKIIRGAELVFGENGYEGASMSQIAARSGVSKGTLYNYFDNKADLFAAFVCGKTDTTLSIVFEPIELETPLEEVLRLVAIRLITQITAPAAVNLYRIVVAEAEKFPRLAQVYWNSGPQRGLTHMADLIRAQMEAGRMAPADPDAAAGQFLSLCQPPSCMMRRLELVPDLEAAEVERLATEAVQTFLHGHDRHR